MATVNRRAFTLVELVVVLSIITILLAIFLPAVQSARTASRRTQCRNNLKYLGLALHNYHDFFRTFPPGWVAQNDAPESGPYVGWQTMILPFLDQQPLYNKFDFNRQSAPEFSNPEIASMTLNPYRCPSDSTPDLNPFRNGLATSNYSGNFGSRALPRLLPDRMSQWFPGVSPTPRESDGIFFCNSTIGSRDIPDGTSNTLMAGERGVASGSGIWLGLVQNQFENDQVTDGSERSPLNRSYSAWSSSHSNGVQVLFCDGTVRFISQEISTGVVSGQRGVFQRLCSRNDGGAIGDLNTIQPAPTNSRPTRSAPSGVPNTLPGPPEEKTDSKKADAAADEKPPDPAKSDNKAADERPSDSKKAE